MRYLMFLVFLLFHFTFKYYEVLSNAEIVLTSLFSVSFTPLSPCLGDLNIA